MINIFRKKVINETAPQKDEIVSTVETSLKSNAHRNNTLQSSVLLGDIFGDYVVVDDNERDISGHKLLRCVCFKCGDSFRTTSYELLKGRKKTTCKNCSKITSESGSPIKNDSNNKNDTLDLNGDLHISNESYDEICPNVFVRELKQDLLSMPV